MYCHHHHHPPLVVGPVEIVEIVLVESCRLLGVEEPLWLTARATAGASADILEKLEVGVLHGDGEERKGRKWNERSIKFDLSKHRSQLWSLQQMTVKSLSSLTLIKIIQVKSLSTERSD